jgi:hypothetical protein
MEYLKVSIQDAQDILNYLKKQPFDEVYQLVPILVNAERITEEENDGGKEEEGING